MPGLIHSHVHFFGAPKGHGIMEWATVPGVLTALRSVKDLNALLHSGFTAVREIGKVRRSFGASRKRGSIRSPKIV
ncbi:MAG: amidohydrolase family protein [Nitrososphaerota archaeon]|nr:amidohydrolase family protein [Nitrososphaerota archaeon]